MRTIMMCRIVLAALLVPAFGFSASIESLVGQADAVIIGVGSQPTKTGHIVTLRLLAERVLKGSVEPGTVLYLDWDSGTDDVLWKTPPTLHGIWFLRSIPGGWEIISAKPNQNKAVSNLLYPTSAAALPSALTYSENDAIADKLILEIGGVPENGPSAILQATSGTNSPSVMRLFRYLAQSKSVDEKATGLAGLLERGDAAAVQQLENESKSLSASRAFGYVTSALGIAFRTTAPKSINALGRIATGQGQIRELRLAASQALSAIHTRETLPYLALLLDDPNPMLVSCGVVGLSFFANGVGIQTVVGMPGLDHLNKRQPSGYRTSETERYLGIDLARQPEYVDFWRRWWNMNRTSLEQP
jgi:hypothetical protein